jgi:hypothetical protein
MVLYADIANVWHAKLAVANAAAPTIDLRTATDCLWPIDTSRVRTLLHEPTRQHFASTSSQRRV